MNSEAQPSSEQIPEICKNCKREIVKSTEGDLNTVLGGMLGHKCPKDAGGESCIAEATDIVVPPFSAYESKDAAEEHIEHVLKVADKIREEESK